MYIGRIVAIGMTSTGQTAAMYRVSSRSFPNREARLSEKSVSIMPRKGFEDDLSKNPYIAYNCIKIAGDYAVATNGSQTDPVAEKISSGMPVRDALALSLLAMDYEKDSYCTPRIAAVVHLEKAEGFLATVRKDALLVSEFTLRPATAFYVATYEKNSPCASSIEKTFTAVTASECCEFMINGGVFASFEHPVTAACAVSTGKTFEFAVKTI
ncbi:MAG: IMP cyclohydrolase [Lentisphaerae bacterium GWF2_45_14]|nr:MAG: IMP cyclohydrolase [Lentisphaerae bacterium GWF2_45_14]